MAVDSGKIRRHAKRSISIIHLNVVTFSKLNAALVILSLSSVFILPSQSASSFITYFLALSVLVSVKILWNDAKDATTLISFITMLLIYLPLTSFWSDTFSARGLFSVSIRSFLILAFILTFAVSLSRVIWFERYLARAITVCALVAAIAALIGYKLTPPWDGRLVGYGQLEVNVFAALVFGVALIFALYLIVHEQGFWKVLAYAASALLVLVIVLSGSRNAWVSVFVGSAAFFLANTSRNSCRWLGWVGGLLLSITVGVVLVIQAVPESQDLLLPRSDSFRLEIWRHVFSEVVEDGLWFGKGILSDNNVYSNGMEFLHPHSLYLTVLFDGGLLGVGLFLGLIVVAVKSLLDNYAAPDAKLGLGVFTLALLGYSLDGWELVDKVGSTWLLMWLPVGIAIKLHMDTLKDTSAP